MKKALWSVVLLSFFAVSSASSQEIGTAALSGEEMGKQSDWQALAFAGSAMVTAALGIFLVSLHEGQGASAH